jgi:hypothetical protein
MKFNSQICTTKEQSERLLALGLKKETADMHYYQYVYGGRWNVAAQPSIAGYNNRIVPAWSLHRLIEIAQLPQYWEWISGDWYEEVIAYIQSMIHINEFNKEYLEVK